VDALVYLVALVALVLLFLVLRRRASAEAAPPSVNWGRLAAIAGCALAAVLVGLLL
jgi:hypothetical protein